MLENSLLLQLYSISSFHLCLSSSLQQIFVHLALMRQCLCNISFAHLLLTLPSTTSLGPSQHLSSPPPPPPLSDPPLLPLFLITVLYSVSHILLESSPGLMLMTHRPTWKHFLCGCEGAFTAVNENLNNAPPCWNKRKKKEIYFFSSYPNIATFDERFINLSMMHFSIW